RLPCVADAEIGAPEVRDHPAAVGGHALGTIDVADGNKRALEDAGGLLVARERAERMTRGVGYFRARASVKGVQVGIAAVDLEATARVVGAADLEALRRASWHRAEITHAEVGRRFDHVFARGFEDGDRAVQLAVE